jgi:hypothetical protein
VALSLRKSHPACFLIREQREDDDGNEPNHGCFPFGRRFALSSAAAPCVPIEQLCVFAYGITIEGATRTPMWFYTSTLRRRNAGKRTCDWKRLLKNDRAKLGFAIPAISFEATTILSSATPGKPLINTERESGT